MPVLLIIHSWVRWAVLLVGLTALIKHVVGLVRKSDYDAMSRGLLSAYLGLFDLQVVLGILLLITNWGLFSAASGGGLPRRQLEHAFIMLVGMVAGHLLARGKDKPAAVRTRNGLIAILVTAAAVVIGVTLLGVSRWTFRI